MKPVKSLQIFRQISPSNFRKSSRPIFQILSNPARIWKIFFKTLQDLNVFEKLAGEFSGGRNFWTDLKSGMDSDNNFQTLSRCLNITMKEGYQTAQGVIMIITKGWARSLLVLLLLFLIIILLSLICFHLLMLLLLLYLFIFVNFFALCLTIAIFKYHARRNYHILDSQNFFTGNEIGNHYPKSRKIIPEKSFVQACNVFDPHGILIKILQLCLKKGFKIRMKGLVTSFPEWFYIFKAYTYRYMGWKVFSFPLSVLQTFTIAHAIHTY